MRLTVLLYLSLALVATAHAQLATVSRVTANQFGSFVRIEYDLEGPADTPIAISIAASNDTGAYYSLPCTTVYGDVGMHQSPGTGKLAVWDVATDLPESTNPTVQIWVKTWIPAGVPTTASGSDFAFVYANSPVLAGTSQLTVMPGFYVTPCPVDSGEAAPAIPPSLIEAYPDYAFEVFRETVAGASWGDLRDRTAWADAGTAACTQEDGWRLAAYYWPSTPDAPVTPILETRPWVLTDNPATSATFALETLLVTRDLDEDGVADDKLDLDQDGVSDVLQDYDGDKMPDAFEDAIAAGIADAYEGAGPAIGGGFSDADENHVPDFFESRYPILSTSHPRGDRVYFNGNIQAQINPYQPGASGYRWRLDASASAPVTASDAAFLGAGPHPIAVQAGNGIRFLHVAAMDGQGNLIPGSARRFTFNTSLNPPDVRSETHPEPSLRSDGRVLGASVRMGYGPKTWRADTVDPDVGQVMLNCANKLWIVQPDGDVWVSPNGLEWQAVTLEAPWTRRAPDAGMRWVADAQLSAVVFQELMWVYASSRYANELGTETGVAGQLWTSADGAHWTAMSEVPWLDREAPRLVEFQEALFAIGGKRYAGGLPENSGPVWRTEDGVQWTKLAENGPWGVGFSPNIIPFGDSLWYNALPLDTLFTPLAGSGPQPWSSRDGVYWQRANLANLVEKSADKGLTGATTGLPMAFVRSLFEGDWQGWESMRWRYAMTPWLTPYVSFAETLWEAGPEPFIPISYSGAGSIWHIGRDDIYESAVRFNPTCDLVRPVGISAFGRIQVFGRDDATMFSSQYGEHWSWDNRYNLTGRGFRLAVLGDSLWVLDQYRVWQLEGNGERTPRYVSNRSFPGFAAFENKLWLFSGETSGSGYLADVRSSVNGSQWQLVTDSAPWGPRKLPAATAFDGQLWLLGGTEKNVGLRNDVWKSPDGITWTLVQASAPWSPRENPGIAVHEGALWLSGGIGADGAVLSDVWYSTDGATWAQDQSGLGVGTHDESLVVAHQDSLFLIPNEADDVFPPVRRRGRAYVPRSSFSGLRYVIDTSPSTVPGADTPLLADVEIMTEPLPPGDYWLHLVAVDTLGNTSPVVHRAYHSQIQAAPSVSINGISGQGTVPSNRVRVDVDRSMDGPYYYALNPNPDGTVEEPLDTGSLVLPCLAEGTYWLAVEATDLYGYRSARYEREVTVVAPKTTGQPTIHFAGRSANEEERLPVTPGDVPLSVTPASWSDVPVRLVVDQRYGFTTDFSDAEPLLSTSIVVPSLGVGRHFLHAQAEDNCGLPSAEGVRSTFVRRRYAPLITFGSATEPETLRLQWTSIGLAGVTYRYVLDTLPDTVPDLTSPETTDTFAVVSVPPGAWQAYFHVCIVDPTGDFSYPGHLQISSDETGTLGVWGPDSTGATVNYRVYSGAAGSATVDGTQLLVHPLELDSDYTLKKVVPSGSPRYTQISVTRLEDGPVAIELPLGSVVLGGEPLPASQRSATGMIDATPPAVLITNTERIAEPEPGLLFEVSAPDAEDFYLPARLVSLEMYPSLSPAPTPAVTFDAGRWRIFFPDVDVTRSVRLKIDGVDFMSTAPKPYNCTGYDRAGNCIDTLYNPWVDLGDEAPVLSIAAPATEYVKNGAIYTLTLSEPVNHALDVGNVMLVSDPPGAVTADLALTTVNAVTSRVTLSNVAGDGVVYLVAVAGFAVDPKGNPSDAALSETRLVDSTPPSISFGEPVLPPILGDPITVPFSITGAVDTPLPTVTIQKSTGVTGTVTPQRIDVVDDTQHYEAQVLNYTGVGTITVSVLGSSVADLVGNKALTAKSDPVPVDVYRVTIAAVGMGSIVPDPGTYPLSPGSQIQLRASVEEGARFLGWTIGTTSVSTANTSHTVNANTTITARFSLQAVHRADKDGDNKINLSELLRIIQFYNSGGLSCAANPESTEDGFTPGPGQNHSCAYHDSDYQVRNWIISLSELLRVIQFYNIGGYSACVEGEDGYCPEIH